MTTGYTDRFKGKQIASYASQGHFGKGGETFRHSGTIYANVSTTGVAGNGADTNEDTLDSFTLPANSLVTPSYSGVAIYAWGKFADNSTSKVARVYCGTTNITTTGANTTTHGISWALQLDVVMANHGNQVATAQGIAGSTPIPTVTTFGTDDETANMTVKVTGQSSSASANDIVLNGWYVVGMN